MSQSTSVQVRAGLATFEVTLGSRALADRLGIAYLNQPAVYNFLEAVELTRSAVWNSLVPGIHRNVINLLLVDWEAEIADDPTNEYRVQEMFCLTVTRYD